MLGSHPRGGKSYAHFRPGISSSALFRTSHRHPAAPKSAATNSVCMAGPCSVESEKQIMETAEAVAAAGAKLLRGGAYKPRTSPYDFQGMEEAGLKLLARAREATGLAVITEVMSDRVVDLVCGNTPTSCRSARAIQCRIFALLSKRSARCGRPVLRIFSRLQRHHQGIAPCRPSMSWLRGDPARDVVRAWNPYL